MKIFKNTDHSDTHMDILKKVRLIGLVFLVLSGVLYILDYKFTLDLGFRYSNRLSEILKDPLYWVTHSLESYAIPITLVAGLTIILLSFLRSRLLYAVLYSLPLWIYPIITRVWSLIPEEIMGQYHLYYLLDFLSHGGILGVLTGIFIAGYFIKVNFQKEIWIILSSMILGPLILCYNFVVVLRIIGVGIGTWLVWHFLTPLVMKLEIRGVKEDEIVIKFSDFKGPRDEDILRWITILIAFSYGIASIIATFYHVLEPSEIEQTLEIIIYSHVVMLALSIFAVPVKWLLDSYGLRLVDPKTLKMEPMEKIALVEETSTALFLISIFTDIYEQLPNFSQAITLTYTMFLTILPSATIAVSLYYFSSIRRHWKKLRWSMTIFEVKSLRDVLNIKIPPPPS